MAKGGKGRLYEMYFFLSFFRFSVVYMAKQNFGKSEASHFALALLGESLE